MLTNVTFRDYKIAVREQNERGEVFDLVRKKWVPLTPEEWVRQHVLHYLIFDKEYPRSLIAVERGFELNGLKKRFDIVVFDRSGSPFLLIECKAPGEPLNVKALLQSLVYNLRLNVAYLWISNGEQNFCYGLKNNEGHMVTVPDFPKM
jgi:Type I restriction enzyme R protein N terminus (HSDR_N).